MPKLSAPANQSRQNLWSTTKSLVNYKCTLTNFPILLSATPTCLDPLQGVYKRLSQKRQILRDQHQAKGEHPNPKTGRKLRRPPRISSRATTTRTAKEDGLRNHRMDFDILIGTRRSIIAKKRFSSVVVVMGLAETRCD